MQEDIQTVESSNQSVPSVSEQPSVKPGAKYTDDEVNGMVARAKRDEREKLAKQQPAAQALPDIDRMVDEKVNARIEGEKAAAFDRSIASKLLVKFPEGEKKYEDFHNVVNSFDPREDRALLNEVSGHENSVDLLYALGKSPTRADSFNRGLNSANPAKRAQTAQELKEFAKKVASKQAKSPVEPPAPKSRMKNSADVHSDNGGDDVLEAAKQRARARY
jgi:hypothetical protein